VDLVLAKIILYCFKPVKLALFNHCSETCAPSSRDSWQESRIGGMSATKWCQES
jgi:hypothetical protein